MATGVLPSKPRFLTEGLLRAAFAGGVTLLAVLAVVFVAIPLYSSTLPPPCGGGGPEPALSCALSVGKGDGECAAGNATYAWNCTYQFALSTRTARGVPTVTIQDLNFEIVKASGVITNSAFSVTVLAPSGCSLGAYNSSINSWGPPTSPSPCNASFLNSTPIQSGDSLVLATIPEGGLPYSGVGDQLLLVGEGELSGTISAAIE